MKTKETQFFSFLPKALVRVTGDDAKTFLQGQFTNDLQQEKVNVAYGLWLNQKGRVLADSHVLRLAENEFLLVSVNSPAAIIRQRLEQYIIADDVGLVDETEKFHGLAVWGAECGERMKDVFGKLPEHGRFVSSDEMQGFTGRRMKDENYEIIGPGKKIAVLRDRLLEMNCSEVGAGEIEFARISDGIPAVPQDIGPGDLPNEGGLEQVAISYTKGCYLGQEVMARLKNMGQVRRRLHVVRGSGARPQPQAAVFQNDKQVGEISSVAGRGNEFVALAMLSLLNLNPEAGLSLGPNQPATLRISPHE